MALATHLHADQPPPPAYVRLILCRDVFHCTPDELRRQRWRDIEEVLICLDMEAKARKARKRG